jgi:Flp pilus assembly protein TadD
MTRLREATRVTLANMADVLARIGIAAVATLVATALAYELHAYDVYAPAAAVATSFRAPPAQREASLLHDLERASDLRPGTQALIAAATLEVRLGHPRAGARFAERATRREADNFSAWSTLGVALGAAGDASAAKAAYARARELNPRFVPPRG